MKIKKKKEININKYKNLTDKEVKEAIINTPNLVIKDYFYILDKLKIKP